MYKPYHIAQIKRKTLRLFAMIFFISCISFNSTYASHAAGGEIIYKHLNDTTYLVTFKFYRDCSGIPEQPNASLCVYDSCSKQIKMFSLPKIDTLPGGIPNGTPVALGCPNYSNTCQDPSVTLPGYQEWWYQDTITLVGRCSQLRMSTTISNRNASMNISTANFYVEATLNNKDVLNNNSAVFYTKPVPYVCINQSFTYNNGAFDADGDSLVFEAINPINGSATNCAGPQVPLPFNMGAFPPLGLPNNPFQTNNTYSLNTATGSISYTPGLLGPQATAIKVTEYRNGFIVGSTIRDIQVQVQPCNNSPIDLTLDTLSIVNGVLNNDIIDVCINKKLDFCYDIVAADPTAIVAVSDNKHIVLPQASNTYTNNATDSIRGCFSWTPSIADTGLKVLTIIAKDSTCKAPGISVSQVFTIPIRVNTHASAPVVTSPVLLCQGIPTTPLTANGRNLLWYTSAGGGTGSTTAPTPDVSTVGTQYYYVSATPNGCESARSMIRVDVLEFPEVDLLTSDDTVCELGHLFAWNSDPDSIPSVSYSWSVDTGKITAYLSDSIGVFWSEQGLKRIILTVSNNACSISDTEYIYVKQAPHPSFEMPTYACLGEAITLIPKDEDGFYYWTLDDLEITDTIFQPSYYLTWSTPGTKRITLTMSDNNGCVNIFTDSISIKTYPVARINGDLNDLCIGKSFTLSTEAVDRYKYKWTPPQFFDDATNHTVNGIAEYTTNIILGVTNSWNCTSYDTVRINAPSCCDITLPDAFSPNGDGINDFYTPINTSKVQVISFMIADRRGEVVYNDNDVAHGWNGIHNGKDAAQATYNYYIKFLCTNGETKVKKGTVILLR